MPTILVVIGDWLIVAGLFWWFMRFSKGKYNDYSQPYSRVVTDLLRSLISINKHWGPFLLVLLGILFNISEHIDAIRDRVA